MTGPACFEIAVDFFDPSGEWHPNTRVRSFINPSSYSKCTCEDIVRTTLRGGKWFEKFTQRTLYLSASSLGEALKMVVEPLGVLARSSTTQQQEKTMFDLKQLCECDRRPDGNNGSKATVPPEHPITLQETSLMIGREFGSHSITAPVDMSFDRLLRPTPTVMRLASFKSSNFLKRKINAEIRKVITTRVKLRAQHHQPGYIYIMQRDHAPDCIKIGFSRKDTAIRMDDLRACFSDLRVVARTNQVPCASKIARLVHAELMYHRRWQDYAKCGKQNREWFEISPKIAKHVIMRWSCWIASTPYQEDGTLKKIWKVLKDSKKDNVVELVDPVKHYMQRKKKGTELNSTKLDDLRKQVNSVKVLDVDEEVPSGSTTRLGVEDALVLHDSDSVLTESDSESESD